MQSKMCKKLLLSFQCVLFGFFVSAQSFEDLSKNLLKKSGLTDTCFEQSIAKITSKRWSPNDTIREYRQWLADNKKVILKNSSDNFKALYFLHLATANRALEEFDSIYPFIDSAANYINFLQFPEAYYQVLKYGSNMAKSHQDYTTATRFMAEIIDSKVLENDSIRKGKILLSLSSILVNIHRYTEASNYCQQAYDIFQGTNDDAKMISVLRIMYEAAHLTSEEQTSMEYLYQARDIAEQSADSALMANVYSVFGLANYRNGDQLEAIRYYKKARALISEKGSNSELWAATYQHLSYVHLDSVEPACKLSKYLLEQCLKNNSPILSNAYRGRAWCFAKRGQNDSAAYYLQLAAEKRESGEKADASPGFYYYMYDVAMLIEDYQLALKYLNKSLIQFRKYYRKSVAEELTATRAKFDYDLQKERIKKLKLKTELEHKRVQKQRVVNIFIIVLLIGAVFFFIYRRKQMKNLSIAYKNLVKKNLELDKINNSLKKPGEKRTKNNNGINIKDEEKIYVKLKNLLEKDKIFRQKDLSESKLTKLLDSNTSYISSIINNRFGMSFKTLLNKYRIDEARQLLVSDEYSNYSIEGIANEVGYQSRSAFYQVFKQNTGMTPTDYVKTYKQIED